MSPAFLMNGTDHVNTASYANTAAARAFRSQQRGLTQSGNFAGAMRMDIQDVATNPNIKGNYQQGIQEMINYARRAGYIR